MVMPGISMACFAALPACSFPFTPICAGRQIYTDTHKFLFKFYQHSLMIATLLILFETFKKSIEMLVLIFIKSIALSITQNYTCQLKG